jgi:hypothetical protein
VGLLALLLLRRNSAIVMPKVMRATPQRILVVEDEDIIQMLLCSQLEDMGFEVEITGSAAAAATTRQRCAASSRASNPSSS